MRRYLVKRLLALIPILLMVGFIGFLLLNLIPGDPAYVILGPEATMEQANKLRAELGLDLPIYIRLIYWYGRLFRGDLGNSIYFSRPVLQVILHTLEPTILLTIFSLIIASAIGITSGIVAALKRGTWVDQIVTGISILGLSIPGFWLAIILIIVFCVWVNWFPVAGYEPLQGGFLKTLQTLVLPSLALGFEGSAFITRITRSSMLEVMSQEYIKVARAKGLSYRVVILKHAFKNALIPIVTGMGLTFGHLLSGAVVIESVFALPGIGQLALSSIMKRDYPLTQGILLFTATVFIVVNLLVDILYAVLDPRVKYE
jgi:peptide/nickel transport system permease protein